MSPSSYLREPVPGLVSLPLTWSPGPERSLPPTTYRAPLVTQCPTPHQIPPRSHLPLCQRCPSITESRAARGPGLSIRSEWEGDGIEGDSLKKEFWAKPQTKST